MPWILWALLQYYCNGAFYPRCLCIILLFYIFCQAFFFQTLTCLDTEQPAASLINKDLLLFTHFEENFDTSLPRVFMDNNLNDMYLDTIFRFSEKSKFGVSFANI